jgi:hypothetical protein
MVLSVVQNDTFQNYIKNNPKPLIWIHFHNPQIGINTQIKNFHIYEQFSTIDKKMDIDKTKKMQKYKLIVILLISSQEFNFQSN